MKKKTKTFVGIVTFLLIVFVLYLVNGLVGNTISRFNKWKHKYSNKKITNRWKLSASCSIYKWNNYRYI